MFNYLLGYYHSHFTESSDQINLVWFKFPHRQTHNITMLSHFIPAVIIYLSVFNWSETDYYTLCIRQLQVYIFYVTDNGTTDPAVLQEIKTMCQSALFTVLRQELVRFDHLLSLVHRSLNGLILGVKGEMVMSESLEETYEALLKQRVPHHWKVE